MGEEGKGVSMGGGIPYGGCVLVCALWSSRYESVFISIPMFVCVINRTTFIDDNVASKTTDMHGSHVQNHVTGNITVC